MNTGEVLAGRYRMLRVLGTGAMGQVWLADDMLLGRRVAVKELRQTSSHVSKVAASRAIREARLVARLDQNPHAVSVHDLVVDGDCPYLILGYVEGPTLAEQVRAEGRLAPDIAAVLIGQVANALAAAHEVGIVHRDVKPANIIISGDGSAHLTDFGVARSADEPNLTQAGELIGTIAFMPPELADGHESVPASDIWSLGATFYFAVEGFAPNQGANAAEILRRVSSGHRPHPANAGPYSALIDRMLDTSPAARPSASDVARALTKPTQRPHPKPLPEAKSSRGHGPSPGTDGDLIAASDDLVARTAGLASEALSDDTQISQRREMADDRYRTGVRPAPSGARETELAPAANIAQPSTGQAVKRRTSSRRPWIAAGVLLILVVGAAVVLGLHISAKSPSADPSDSPRTRGPAPSLQLVVRPKTVKTDGTAQTLTVKVENLYPNRPFDYYLAATKATSSAPVALPDAFGSQRGTVISHESAQAGSRRTLDLSVQLQPGAVLSALAATTDVSAAGLEFAISQPGNPTHSAAIPIAIQAAPLAKPYFQWTGYNGEPYTGPRPRFAVSPTTISRFTSRAITVDIAGLEPNTTVGLRASAAHEAPGDCFSATRKCAAMASVTTHTTYLGETVWHFNTSPARAAEYVTIECYGPASQKPASTEIVIR